MSSNSETHCGCKSNQNMRSQSVPTTSITRTDVGHVSIYSVPKMDCPSEENLIRTAFARLDDEIVLTFDLSLIHI